MHFTVDRDFDPDGSKLRNVLELQFACDRMSAARSFCAHLLAFVGGFIWLEAIWPGFLPAEFRLFTLVLWGGILVIALWAAVEEQVSRRRLKNCLAARKGVGLIGKESP